MSVLNDEALERYLAQLHEASDRQVDEMRSYFAGTQEPAGASDQRELQIKAYLSDKLVALDRDKAEFCYQLLRGMDARRVVEVGTSYGVSTLYLAAALRDNVRGTKHEARVIATEYEPAKAQAARRHFAEARLDSFIELREGDLRETLKSISGPIDFVLIDIWVPMARPALELLASHLRRGAIIVCDNTESCRRDYEDYFEYLAAPANGFRTITLPFEGGLEMSVYDQ